MPTTETTHGNLVSEARGRVENFVSGVKDKAESLKKKSFEDLWEGTRDYVRDNPGKTVLIALAAGTLLGSFLRRR